MNTNSNNIEEKEVYELLNYVKLDEKEFEHIDAHMSNSQKKKLKSNLKNNITKNYFKRIKYASCAAVIGFTCLIGISYVSPTFAEGIPVLNSINQYMSDKLGLKGDYSKYSKLINKTVSSNGISLTINEVLCDDANLVMSYTIKSDKKVKDLEQASYKSNTPPLFLGTHLKINEKSYGLGGGMQTDYIDEYTCITKCEIDVASKNLPKNLNIDLNIDNILGVKGNWNFAFSVSKEEINKNSKTFKPNIKLSFPNDSITVDKVLLSPINTSIFISGNHNKKNKSSDIQSGIFDYDHWLVFDDTGKELIPKGTHGSSGSLLSPNKFTYEFHFAKLDHVPKYLTIIPCDSKPYIKGSKSVDGKTNVTNIQPKTDEKTIDGTYPINLSQGKIGSLKINEIKTENNKTIVKYEVNGKAPYFQGSNLSIKNSKGEQVTPIDGFNISQDKDNPNKLTKEFTALNPNEKYTIYTDSLDNYDLKEDLKFNIELK